MRFLLLLGFLRVACMGCSCAMPIRSAPCERAWQFEAVFAGVVTDVYHPGMPVVQPGQPPPDLQNYPQQRITLKVTEVFSGLDPATKEIVIATGLGGGDCGIQFERGLDYLVYASRSPRGGLSTGICTPTRPVAQAAEDLKYLRSLPELPVAGEIRVTAFDPHRTRDARSGELAGLSGAKISIEGQNLRRSAVADSAGRAIFPGLTPGNYTVAAFSEGYRLSGPVAPVRLHARGCAEVAAPLELDTTLRGVVRMPDGQPAVDVPVEAVRARPLYEGESPLPADTAVTDRFGRYEFRRLTAGDYYVGTSLALPPDSVIPWRRWFFPGTERPSAAVLAHVDDRPGAQTLDLTLPEPMKLRVAQCVVLWPDGTPAGGAQIRVHLPDWPWGNPRVVTTDAAGRFTLDLLDGIAYRLRASHIRPERAFSELYPIEPGADALTVRLVLAQKAYPRDEPDGFGKADWRKLN